MEMLMKNRNQHLLNERQCGLGMYLFGLSTLGEMSNNFRKKSNFVEDKVEYKGEIIQNDMNDTQKKSALKFNICESDMNDTQKKTRLKCNMCKSDKHDIIDDKKNEITTVVGLISVFN
jgi:hypothetical protein